jgi:hypothetical protein
MTRSATPIRRAPALATLLLAVAFSGCAPAGSPGPSQPASGTPGAPTQVPVEVTTPAAAAAIVVGSDPRFAGAVERTPDLIGGSKWWEASVSGDGFRVVLTVGWGDCPAGCINRHTWTFDVGRDGSITPLGDSGDPLPPGSLPD